MLKERITYTDYNGIERTEDFYFNLTKAEILEMEMSENGGFKNIIERIIQTKDMKSMLQIFKDLVLRSYGEKSNDGKRFIKSPELSEAFKQTEAYSNLFMKLASDDKAAARFVNGIVPSDVAKEMEQNTAKNEALNATQKLIENI